MSSVNLVLTLLGKDQSLGKTLKGAGRDADEAHAKFKRFAKGAGTALAGVGLAAFAADSIKAFGEAEASQVKLEGAYKRFPKLADTNIDALRGLNKELQSKTAFDDDDLAAMQAKLAMFDLTGKQIEQLTPLVADYAQATGKDLETSATMVGKAMLGNAKALKTIGVNYKSTGDQAVDFANIQDLLRQKVGGTAEEFGGTTLGQLKILENQYGDLKETIGEGLAPALGQLITVVKPVVSAFSSLPTPVQSSLIVATGAALAFGKLAPAMTAVKTAGVGVKGMFVANTAATVADTAATEANAAAKVGMSRSAKVAATGIGVLAVALAGYELARSAADDLEAGGDGGFLHKLSENAGSGKAALTSLLQTMDAFQAKGFDGAVEDIAKQVQKSSGLFQAASQTAMDFGTGLAAIAHMENPFEAIGNAREFERGLAAMKDFKPTALGAAVGAGVVGKSLTELGGQAADSADDLDEFKQKLEDALSPGLDLADATIRVRDGLADLTRAATENTATLNMNTQKGRDNRSVLIGMIRDNQNLAVATQAANKDGAAAYNAATQSLIKTATAAGFNKQQIQNLIRTYGALPKQVGTRVEAQTTQLHAALGKAESRLARLRAMKPTPKVNADISQAQQRVDEIRAKLSSIPDEEVLVHVRQVGAAVGAGVTGRNAATGVRNSEGFWATVGERGPERMWIPPSAEVLTHSQSLASLATGRSGKLTAKQKEKLKNQLDSRKRSFDSYVSSRDSQMQSVAGSLRGFGSLTGFDTTANADALTGLADAQKDVTSAQNDVQAARRNMNVAKSMRDRQEAAAQLADAEAKLNDARAKASTRQQEVADTAATSANFLKRARDKLGKLNALNAVVRQLGAKGLNRNALHDIVAEGPEAGLIIGQELLRSGFNEINATQNQIDAVSNSLGRYDANVDFGGRIRQAANDYNTTLRQAQQGAVGNSWTTPKIDLHVYLDAEEIGKNQKLAAAVTGAQKRKNARQGKR